MSRPREDLITVKTGTIDCGVELEPDNVESVSEFGMKRANGKGKELITADERFPPPVSSFASSRLDISDSS